MTGKIENSHPGQKTQRPTLIQRPSLTNTLQGAVMGTPKCMSPKQAMGCIDKLDARSDMPVPPTTPTSGLIPTVSIQRVLEVG
jgi:hypothetical protein